MAKTDERPAKAAAKAPAAGAAAGADAQAPRRFATARGWAAWLARHHAKSGGVWLLIAKAGAPQATVSYVQAVEVALCHGWIDAQSKGGNPYWLQRFTPRRPREATRARRVEQFVAILARGEMLHPAKPK